MNRRTRNSAWRWLVVLVICVASAIPASAAHPSSTAELTTPNLPLLSTQTSVVDVGLTRDGVLHGRLFGSNNQPVAGKRLFADSPMMQQQETQTDAAGWFSFGPLRGGVYTIRVGRNTVVARAWSQRTAPPNAKQSLCIRTHEDTNQCIRGQSPIGEFFWSDRFLFAATIAGAIAVPIIVHGNRHNDAPSGS